MIKNIFVVFLAISISTICLANKNIAVKDVPLQSYNRVEKSIQELYGYWKVVDYKWAGISSNEEKKPQRHVGKTILFFGSDHAQLLVGLSIVTCKVPEYNFHYEKNTANYLFNDSYVRPNEVGIKTTDLNVIDISCAGENNLPGYGPKASVFVINKNTIIYTTDGPFYRLQKVKKNNDTKRTG